ncbi:hypothetical protein A0H81_12271 [Grifola frondosa]|uniref:Uncharacterized protein n=1 Tax=Grifola frondosa TaxID=5627 RepID=A0A1C7LUI2_GRIFR|nr:hypothetical protein A0H81_12271 [Grifola frondosa]
MADVLMLLVMLLGIWLKRGSGNLWRLVIRQGLIWVLVPFFSPFHLLSVKFVSMVLISLNLNDAMNMLFQTPVSVSMTICSTRMHRSLYEFANSGQVVVDVNLGGSCRTSQSTAVRRSPNGGLVPMVHITRTVETDTVKTSQASTLCADV